MVRKKSNEPNFMTTRKPGSKYRATNNHARKWKQSLLAFGYISIAAGRLLYSSSSPTRKWQKINKSLWILESAVAIVHWCPCPCEGLLLHSTPNWGAFFRVIPETQRWRNSVETWNLNWTCLLTWSLRTSGHAVPRVYWLFDHVLVALKSNGTYMHSNWARN